MKNPLERYKTITNFKLANINLKIIMESSTPLDEFTQQIETFRRLQTMVSSMHETNIQQIPDLLSALQAFDSIHTVEITNPNNNNGFIFDLSSP